MVNGAARVKSMSGMGHLGHRIPAAGFRRILKSHGNRMARRPSSPWFVTPGSHMG